MNPEPAAPAAAHALARFIAVVALLVAGVVLAWFGWIDAPISDGAMVLVAAGLLLAVLAAGAALLSLEAGVAADAAAGATGGAWRRWRRLALAFLLAALLVLAVAAVVTLNLRGSGADEDGATATHLAVHRTARPSGHV